MPVFNFVRRSFYRDSVTLMRVSRDVERVPGVTSVAVMMGTPANRALLAEAGLLADEGAAAAASDLVVAVRADSEAAAVAAREAAERALLARPVVGAASAERPRTLAAALRATPQASLALISVPGPYAAAEARKALARGLHVMLFSDNVPLEAEIELKRLALERGRLLMGPDCGTAIVDGVPLGFANAVPRGRIGLAAASGTGLQEVACVIAREGEGVSQALGVGGRDLSDAVGGIMTLRALELLAADADTEVVCVVGKPPGPAVASRLAAALGRIGKPVVVYVPPLAGTAAAVIQPSSAVHLAHTLEDAGRAAVALARGKTPSSPNFTLADDDVQALVAAALGRIRPSGRYVRGVYAGGTLAYEALALLAEQLAGVPVSPTVAGPGHRVIDLGDDAFTVGRPHPMLDARIRREWIEKEGRDPETAALLLDVILGHGTPPDPVGDLLPAIRSAHDDGRVAVIASVCGTDADPTPRAVQVAALRAAGVIVLDSNAQAARLAAAIAARAGAAAR